ncbi:hypothetical protein [Nonomuraea maritima]|uniref:hypothetical protein n=1 Tax=Nonomuraea maritima TaxID=683260 RepID=UPI000B881C9C
MLERIKVRLPVGRPRTRPHAVAADKAYSSRPNRAYLRRHLKAVIPEKSDQAAHRKKATVAASLPLVLILLLRTGWADPERRKVIGVLWDVGTFWPRSYHPFAPPSYAERAVPELQRRIWWLHDNGGRVVLTAHSQGSVLAVAALAQPPQRSSGDRVALVTYGSPVRKLYNWGFPAYFNEDLLRRLDPPTSRFRYGEPVPRVGSHTGYQSDPAPWKAVDQAAALLIAERRQDGDPPHPRS